MHIILVQHFNRIFEHLLKVNFLRRKIWSFALHHDSYCIVEWGFAQRTNNTKKSPHLCNCKRETKCQIQKIQDILIIIFTVVEIHQNCLFFCFYGNFFRNEVQKIIFYAEEETFNKCSKILLKCYTKIMNTVHCNEKSQVISIWK